jgi:hypothetical protein
MGEERVKCVEEAPPQEQETVQIIWTMKKISLYAFHVRGNHL